MASIDQECVSYIGGQLVKGMTAARDHLGLAQMPSVTVAKSNAKVPHYIHGQSMIGLPIGFLEKYSSKGLDTLKEHNVEISVEGMPKEFVSFGDWIASAGVEETIHYLQDVGHESVSASLPNFGGYSNLTRLDMSLAEHEVEARGLVDLILPTMGIKPIWGKLDAFLKETYPEIYGKPAQPRV